MPLQLILIQWRPQRSSIPGFRLFLSVQIIEGVDPAASLTHKPADEGSGPADSIDVDNIRSYPVPEPASMLLVGSGLIVLAGTGRKKFLKKKYR